MISKCANPACPTRFHYLREGKLFRMEFDPERASLLPHLVSRRKPVRRAEHFWLCGRCSATLTLVMNNGAVQVAPIEDTGTASRHAAAS
jgi:hypothetical protein